MKQKDRKTAPEEEERRRDAFYKCIIRSRGMRSVAGTGGSDYSEQKSGISFEQATLLLALGLPEDRARCPLEAEWKVKRKILKYLIQSECSC